MRYSSTLMGMGMRYSLISMVDLGEGKRSREEKDGEGAEGSEGERERENLWASYK